MTEVKTIDLWTEQNENHFDCFKGAFIDGFEDENIPFDTYKVIRNCNCIITSNQEGLNISNKHNAIIFYKEDNPVRLMVINQNTDINKCIDVALDQSFNNSTLRSVYDFLGIRRTDINLNEQPIFNNCNQEKEIDVGSCDRPNLLESMLEGSYTQSDTGYGKSNSDNNYKFIPNIYLQYELTTDNEYFQIEHQTAFLNENMTRIIPLQKNSSLDIDMLYQQFYEDNGLEDFTNFIMYLNSLKDFSYVVIEKDQEKVIYGVMKEGWIDNPIELKVKSTDNLCQDLKDALVNNFKEEIATGYTHSFSGEYEYFMTLENVIVKFPNNYEYQGWIYNQVNEDRQKNSKKLMKK